MEVKTLIVLAKSYKKGGWCIAGKELFPTSDGKFQIGSWIRPVTSDEDSKGAVSDGECQLTNGAHAQVLDIVKAPIESPIPEPGQPENCLITDSKLWEKIKDCHPNHVSKFLESPPDLWLEHGMPTDQITSIYDETHDIAQSLYLISPANLKVTLAQERNDYESKYKRTIKASFEYNNVSYEGLSITDPKIRRMLGRQYPKEGDEPNVITLRAHSLVFMTAGFRWYPKCPVSCSCGQP